MRKHCRQVLMPYFLIIPCPLPHTRLLKPSHMYVLVRKRRGKNRSAGKVHRETKVGNRMQETYQVREPGPYFLGCEFHTAAWPMVAALLQRLGSSSERERELGREREKKVLSASVSLKTHGQRHLGLGFRVCWLTRPAGNQYAFNLTY